MQEKPKPSRGLSAAGSSARSPDRRTNKARTEATRNALIAAARALFVEKGYAETGTPEIVAAAKVTRGALYHHFADKEDLFRATVAREAQAVAVQIARKTSEPGGALEAMIVGAEAYFDAMTMPGRTRLLLLDGPAVLGHTEMAAIDRETGGEELRQGLAFSIEKGGIDPLPLDAMADILSAAFDRAALAIAEGQPPEDYKAVTRKLLTSLFGN
ncbi:TetR/AcrR family transcriptional regulator [Pelagibius sp. Alg239-R121]|uniref:TetR/AcrR family transcriptional regulator n=1 Tax=Pelagibius sp. Alg239-R121 TaxID=2993448 RepID=UPI0024A71D02|nr:TetR/AcrR family transcriptional regulator [Pelagibius sp. Alg239-R121]